MQSKIQLTLAKAVKEKRLGGPKMHAATHKPVITTKGHPNKSTHPLRDSPFILLTLKPTIMMKMTTNKLPAPTEANSAIVPPPNDGIISSYPRNLTSPNRDDESGPSLLSMRPSVLVSPNQRDSSWGIADIGEEVSPSTLRKNKSSLPLVDALPPLSPTKPSSLNSFSQRDSSWGVADIEDEVSPSTFRKTKSLMPGIAEARGVARIATTPLPSARMATCNQEQHDKSLSSFPAAPALPTGTSNKNNICRRPTLNRSSSSRSKLISSDPVASRRQRYIRKTMSYNAKMSAGAVINSGIGRKAAPS